MSRFCVAAHRLTFSVIAAFVLTAFLYSLDQQARPGDVAKLLLVSILQIYGMCTVFRPSTQTAAWPGAIPHQPATLPRPTVNYDLWDRELDG